MITYHRMPDASGPNAAASPSSATRTPDLANAIRPLAILKFDAGETNEARSLWEETRKLYAAVNVEAGVTESSRRLALLAQK